MTDQKEILDAGDLIDVGPREILDNRDLIDVGPREIRVYGTEDNPLFHATDVGKYLGLSHVRDYFSPKSKSCMDPERDFIKKKIQGSSLPVNLLTNQGLVRLIMGLKSTNVSCVYEYIASQVGGLECLNFVETDRRRTEYIHFIGNRENDNKFKIGYTTLPVELSFSIIQDGTSDELYIYKEVPCDNPREFERHLHECFATRHIRGEWFNLSPDEVDQLVAFLR